MNSNPVMKIKTEELTEEDKNTFERLNFSSMSDWIRTNPCNQILPKLYGELAENIQNFKFREDDVMLFSYMKTGTTWMSEILWAMANIHQLHLAEEQSLVERTFVLHIDTYRLVKEGDNTPLAKKFQAVCPNGNVRDGAVLQLAEASTDRRVVRSHLLPHLHHPDLFNTCKVVYVLRNPKDTCCSYFNYYKNYKEEPFHGEFGDMFELFLRGLVTCGSYWNFVRGMWSRRHEPNFHIVFYEDLKKNLEEELQKLNTFFGFRLTQSQIEQVGSHASLSNMKKRENLKKKVKYFPMKKGSFFGEGRVGGWKELMTPEMNQRMDKWIEEQSKGLDIHFTYE